MHAIVASFGHNLTLARDRAGLTQDELYRLSGVHPTEVSRMEHGERNVHIATVARLADALKMSPGELLDGPTGDQHATA